MPIYEFECNTCGVHFERRQAMTDDSTPACPQGHMGVHRVFSPPGIVFKGSGWYVTDSRKASRPASPD